MSNRGHNERSYRLDVLAAEARQGLERVEQGEEFTIGGWLAFGHALNEGRALFPGDREFGEWVALSQLDTADRMDRAAAMWAAANADQFEEARQRGNPRTIRGIHAKWKEIEAEREAKAFAEAQEAARKEAAEKAEQDAERRKAEESEAREAAKKAETEDERVAAQAKLAGAINARKEAEAQAEEAKQTAEVEPEPVAAPDPYGYAKLTEEALLDQANGLRADLDDEKAKRRAAEAQVKALKAQLRDFQGDDKDEVIRRLQASLKQAENAKWKALEDRDAYHGQLFHARKERDAAIKSLQAQEVPV